MKALVCHKFGPVDTMRIRPWPDLKLNQGEVLVDVAYAAVNFPDTLIVQGLYQVKPKVPFIPGHECSGIVRSIGPGVAHVKSGDRVMVSAGTGGMAEQIVVNQYRVKPLPDEVALDVASVLSTAYATSLHALKDMAQLQEGESVLILGGSGGTGSAAIEIAQAMKAKVLVACSTEEKLNYCRKTFNLREDQVINYEEEDLRKYIVNQTLGEGVNVVFDPVGDKYAEPALRSLGFRGRYLVIGFAAGDIPNIPLNLALLKERSIIGVYTGIWSQKRGQEAMNNLSILVNWVKDRKIKPNITARYSLDNAVEALKFASTRSATGKIVIEVNTNLK